MTLPGPRAAARGLGAAARVCPPLGTPSNCGTYALASTPGLSAAGGLVRVEGPRQAPPAGGWDEQDVRLAVLAGLALQYLARDQGRPW